MLDDPLVGKDSAKDSEPCASGYEKECRAAGVVAHHIMLMERKSIKADERKVRSGIYLPRDETKIELLINWPVLKDRILCFLIDFDPPRLDALQIWELPGLLTINHHQVGSYRSCRYRGRRKGVAQGHICDPLHLHILLTLPAYT